MRKTHKKISLLLIMTLMMLALSSAAYAVHDAIVTLTPDITNCDALGNTFTVNIENDITSADDILQVEIYKALAGLSDFTCGAAPSGWSYLPWPDEDRCIYVTGLNSADKIAPGQNLDFTFDATMSSNSCDSSFTIVTVDDASPTGDRDTIQKQVLIDCTDPVILKTVGTPKIPGTGFDYWITQSTPIDVTVTEQDTCDLGLEYCEIKYTVDGGSEITEIYDGNLAGLDLWKYNWAFGEDSEHDITVTCYDVAGNSKVLTETDKVDTQPPITTKSFIPDAYVKNGVEWIDTFNVVVLNALDPEPHPVGFDKTYYVNILAEDAVEQFGLNVDPEKPCRNSTFCDVVLQKVKNNQDRFTFQLYDGPFQKPEESCHALVYYSEDNLGNTEDMQINCFFVDKASPELEKINGDPSYFENSGEKQDTLCYKDDDSNWNCYDTNDQVPTALSDRGYDAIPSGTVTYESYGPFLQIEVEIINMQLNSDYQITLNGRNGGDGNAALAGNCPNPDAPKQGYNFAWECGTWTGNTGTEGFWNFDMTATTDGSGYYKKTYNLIMPDGHYGEAWSDVNGIPGLQKCWPNYNGGANPLCDDRTMWGVGFVVKEAADVPGGSNYPPVLMETNGLDWTIDNSQFLWVTPDTPVTFTCDDQNPHPSEDEELCFKVSYDDPNQPWLTEEYCEKNQGIMENDWCCGIDVSEDTEFVFKFDEECYHDLEYFCRDAVGKSNEIETQYYNVDDTPPVITKTMLGTKDIDYRGDCPPDPNSNTDVCYVADNDVGGVHVAVEDPDPTGNQCNAGEVRCGYTLWWNTTKQECNDANQNYNYHADSKLCEVGTGQFSDATDVLFHEDSTHFLTINCYDALDNHVSETEKFLVDSTPPVTTKTYGEPHYPDNINVPGPYPHWITTQTPITLDATDNKVGVDQTFWRYVVVDNQWCQSEASGCQNYDAAINERFIPYAGAVTLPEESCHLLEFYSVDLLGNEEVSNRQCVFVEDTPPKMGKTVGSPQVAKGSDTFITQDTNITLTCEDLGDHPVDQVTLWYRYRVSNDCADLDAQSWVDPSTYCQDAYLGDWCDTIVDSGLVEKTFTFPEDSCHELEYYCEDALGNTADTQSEIDIVDTVAPDITIDVVGPQIWIDEELYIDGVTNIIVDAIDPPPHPVNDVLCDWDYEVFDVTGGTVIGSGGGTGITPPFKINFPEESYHSLRVTCRDALGNTAVRYEDYVVDKTPPGISKTYDLDKYFEGLSKDEFGVFWAEWITSATSIYGGVTDDGPHKSGIAEVKYKTTRVDDADCKHYLQTDLLVTNGVVREEYSCEDASSETGWTTVPSEEYDGFMFNIAEESCHLIEIMATDKVDKCSLHKQNVFVDNTPPEPVKEVGIPNSKILSEEDYFFQYYPEVNGNCWTGQDGSIDCWLVTLLTPVSLTCEDGQPHPVDRNTVCFKVGLDGDDATQNYCGDIALNDDGFCCVDSELPTFYFDEVSEHNLAYYCKDALGNTGSIDDEKFKVEETKFEIQLNKKWNLISVPVKLLDDSMDAVFADIADKVISVWAFNGSEWFIYTPDGDSGNDDITTMEPGWGYWILMEDGALLTIGGSLFSPAITPPSIPIVHGWNLIGYFGAEGLEGYYGPDLYGDGKPADCVMDSIGQDIWDKEFASLWTYWEPDNPNSWIALNKWNYMNPGAGYWVYTTDSGEYVPTTTCGGFFGPN